MSNAIESIHQNGELSITTQNLHIKDTENKVLPKLPPGNYALIRIGDNGAGMDEQTQERIFEPFFTTKFFGRGLGMAAAYGIVQNHGGMITVESAPNQGTRVSIYLPGSTRIDCQTQSAA